MKSYFCGVVLLASFSMGFLTMTDASAQKADGSFSNFNDPQAQDTYFVGDTSQNAIDNSFGGGGEVRRKTDGVFVGSGTINAQDTLFSGSSYHQQVSSSTIPAFAQDDSQVNSDGVFVGENTQQKTDGSFSGGNYGH